MNLKTRRILFVLLLFVLATTLYNVFTAPGVLNILILIFDLIVVIALGLSLRSSPEFIYDNGESARISYLMNMGNQAEAVQLAEQIYTQSVELLGPKDVNSIHWATIFCRVLQSTGDKQRARELLHTARRNLLAKPLKNPGLYVELLRSLADLYINEKLAHDAATLLDEAEKNLGNVSPDALATSTPALIAQKLLIDMCRAKIMILNRDGEAARTKGWDLYKQAKASLNSNNAYTLLIGNMLLEILDDPVEIKALSYELRTQTPTL